MLGVDEGGDVLHGTGAIECDHRGDVADGRRLQLFDVAGHATAFKLEDADRLAGREQLECVGVIERDVRQVEPNASSVGDKTAGLVEHGQVDQSEKVHLEQSECGDGVHGVLSGGRQGTGLVSPLRALERDDLIERLLGNDDARRVRAGVARYAFQSLCGLDKVSDSLVDRDRLGQL